MAVGEKKQHTQGRLARIIFCPETIIKCFFFFFWFFLCPPIGPMHADARSGRKVAFCCLSSAAVCDIIKKKKKKNLISIQLIMSSSRFFCGPKWHGFYIQSGIVRTTLIHVRYSHMTSWRHWWFEISLQRYEGFCSTWQVHSTARTFAVFSLVE